MRAATVKQIARECGFELCGIAAVSDIAPDYDRYQAWLDHGMAGEMRYLTDHRAEIRGDVRRLLPSARSVICVGKLYNSTQPTGEPGPGRALISRYAWGADYHAVIRASLKRLEERLAEIQPFDSKICVDTAPLLERSLARQAGLGWIGRNSCLINEPAGSWFFLGEIITSLEIESDSPPPDRCGTCMKCIEACPTLAFVPAENGWRLDARRCIAYFTIELRGSIREEFRPQMGAHVFGCDICQDVCPWNSKAHVTEDRQLAQAHFAPTLEELAAMTEQDFRVRFRGTALERPKYAGFLRNVAVAMGNSGLERFREPLERLAANENEMVAEHARWALKRLENLESEA